MSLLFPSTGFSLGTLGLVGLGALATGMFAGKRSINKRMVGAPSLSTSYGYKLKKAGFLARMKNRALGRPWGVSSKKWRSSMPVTSSIGSTPSTLSSGAVPSTYGSSVPSSRFGRGFRKANLRSPIYSGVSNVGVPSSNIGYTQSIPSAGVPISSFGTTAPSSYSYGSSVPRSRFGRGFRKANLRSPIYSSTSNVGVPSSNIGYTQSIPSAGVPISSFSTTTPSSYSYGSSVPRRRFGGGFRKANLRSPIYSSTSNVGVPSSNIGYTQSIPAAEVPISSYGTRAAPMYKPGIIRRVAHAILPSRF